MPMQQKILCILNFAMTLNFIYQKLLSAKILFAFVNSAHANFLYCIIYFDLSRKIVRRKFMYRYIYIIYKR